MRWKSFVVGFVCGAAVVGIAVVIPAYAKRRDDHAIIAALVFLWTSFFYGGCFSPMPSRAQA